MVISRSFEVKWLGQQSMRYLLDVHWIQPSIHQVSTKTSPFGPPKRERNRLSQAPNCVMLLGLRQKYLLDFCTFVVADVEAIVFVGSKSQLLESGETRYTKKEPKGMNIWMILTERGLRLQSLESIYVCSPVNEPKRIIGSWSQLDETFTLLPLLWFIPLLGRCGGEIDSSHCPGTMKLWQPWGNGTES